MDWTLTFLMSFWAMSSSESLVCPHRSRCWISATTESIRLEHPGQYRLSVILNKWYFKDCELLKVSPQHIGHTRLHEPIVKKHQKTKLTSLIELDHFFSEPQSLLFSFFSKRNKLILFFFLHSNFRRKKTIKRWIKNKRRYFGRGLCATCAATLFHSRGHRRRMGFSSRLRDLSHHMCNDWFDVPGWIKVLSRQRTIGDELQRKQMPSTTIMKLVSLGKWMKTRRRHCFGLADLLR